MNVLLFGATGMVGQGVLRECLRADAVRRVIAVGRTPIDRTDSTVREVVLSDLFEFPTVAGETDGCDACFFCLGVSSVGMKEEQYRRITYDLTLTIAGTLAERNPHMIFIYVSGAGTDSTERGRVMWARVKGETENALLALPFRAYMFRPGYIQPMHGVRSKTRLYRVVYAAAAPLFPVLRRLAPGLATSTEQVGRAMLTVADGGAAKRVLNTRDINALAARRTG